MNESSYEDRKQHLYVLYTRSRHEKRVEKGLQEKQIDAYCPLIRVLKQWSDRVKVVEEPLFRSYFFVRLDEKDRSRVFEVPGIVNFVTWLHKPAIIRHEEIQAIQDMLAQHEHSRIFLHRFSQEEIVRIKSGILSDLTGIVKEQKGGSLHVYIQPLQLVVVVDLKYTFVGKNLKMLIHRTINSNLYTNA